VTTNRITLSGCQPEPLMSYLKALGVLRLVAEQADPHARGAWTDGGFALHTALDAATLRTFFLNEYRPTPIMAPWNGGGGFFGVEDKEPNAVDLIAESVSARMQMYRTVIGQVREILRSAGMREKPVKEAKDVLLRRLRAELPDAFVDWIDAVVILRKDKSSFPPILGTGGNDGRLDFTLNFMQHLIDLGLHAAQTSMRSMDFFENAAFGRPVVGMTSKAVGQFDPGRAGGLNMTIGDKGDSQLNPWDFVLMVEGAVLMAGAAVRHMNARAYDKGAMPFTVNTSKIGSGTLIGGEEDRGEIWLPLWENPTGLQELRQIFGEGRAQVGRRQAGNGVDFARAVASLGVDRGLTAFNRYCFLNRNGKAFFATSVGRFEVRSRPDGLRLLDEIDGWLESLRRGCRGDNIPARFSNALRGLEDAVFDYCRFGGAARFGEILRRLGACQRELSLNMNALGKIGERELRPVPLLSAEWLSAAREDSPEFRLALALASIRRSGDVPELRGNIEAVVRERYGWRWAKPEEQYGVVWRSGGLARNLAAVLERRLLDASRTGADPVPLEARFLASAADVALFLDGRTDDARLEEWLWALMLIDLDKAESPTEFAPAAADAIASLPRPYALLKLLFLPKSCALRSGEGAALPAEPTLLAHLRAGRVNDACRHAARRLRASGYAAMPAPKSGGGERTFEFSLPPHSSARLAGALLIPFADAHRLQKLALRPKEKTQ
jgi:CRISPR-associated protein Csx17